MTEKDFMVRESVAYCRNNAQTKAFWSYRDSLGDTIMEKFEALFFKLIELGKAVEETGGRGDCWMVTGPEVASIITSTSAWKEGLLSTEFKPGLTYLGKLCNRWRVWVDPLYPTNELLMGFGYEKDYGQSYGKLTICDFI